MTQILKKQDLSTIDLTSLSDGANLVYDGDQPVAIIMTAKYYAKLQELIKKVKDLMGSKDAAAKK